MTHHSFAPPIGLEGELSDGTHILVQDDTETSGEYLVTRWSAAMAGDGRARVTEWVSCERALAARFAGLDVRWAAL